MDGYADAGPTHYATEDLACLRAIINAHVLIASDGEVARYLAIDAIARPRLSFVRLDRHAGGADRVPFQLRGRAHQRGTDSIGRIGGGGTGRKWRQGAYQAVLPAPNAAHAAAL